MRVALVSMPWHEFDSPSLALGTLAAFIKKWEPRVSVECCSEHVAVWRKLKPSYHAFCALDGAAELLYLTHLYPERADSVTRELLARLDALRKQPDVSGRANAPYSIIDEKVLAEARSVTDDRLQESAATLAQDADLVGLTTSYSQLFSSLCLAKALKRQKPSLRIVLGGHAAGVAGSSLLSEYPFIDFLITGKGELRFLLLLRHMLDGENNIDPATGILTQENHKRATLCTHAAKGEIANLDELPMPDFDEYHAKATANDFLWVIPIEGSRGCWWDRRAKTHNSLQACYFCGLNNHAARSDKSSARIAEEMTRLSSQYRNIRFLFADTLIRRSGQRRLAKAIRGSGRDYSFSLEIRADLKASALADLKQAGCSSVQIGIEGLSTAYLKRLNKGTTTIQNLSAMRTCYELEIQTSSNLILGFPGATEDEVAETRHNILSYGIFYAPLTITPFRLDPGSPAAMQPGKFGLKNVRTHSSFEKSLPHDVALRLQLPWLEFDVEGQQADWSPVVEACTQWHDLHRRLKQQPGFCGIKKSFFYFDGGDFLELVDIRDRVKTLILESPWREVYLYCMEIHSRKEVVARFDMSEDDLVNEVLEPLVDRRLMFKEKDKYLSLAVASTPAQAMRRIHSRENASGNLAASDRS